MKQKNERLDRDLKARTEELDRLQDELVKLEKQNKALLGERDKQKLRITKLISRKGKFDSGLKTCKNCSKEYNEKENFNWSCKQHRGDWGGQMWWCCGKQNKDGGGCKFSKHESKEDEDDDLEDGTEAAKLKARKYTRCHCCKELGHQIAQCPRDPNLKTGQDPENEASRIQKIRDFRKLYADTVIQTTHFLKKSIMIPLKVDEEGAKQNIEVTNPYHPFMRGVMEFDDYNYKLYNPYVLLKEPEDEAHKRRMAKLDAKQLQGDMSEKLSAKAIERYEADYEHDAIRVEPSEAEKREAAAEERRKAEEEALRQKLAEEGEKAAGR